MPDPTKFAAAKKRLIKGLRKIIRDCEQIGRDIEWWNANRLDAAPFDRGGDLCAAKLAKECLSLVESDQHLPDTLWARLQQQLRDNAAE